MLQTTTTESSLYRNRNRTVARSFFRHLKSQGFTAEQIIELSTDLLDLVTEDMQSQSELHAK
jgi:hypothetical protein